MKRETKYRGIILKHVGDAKWIYGCYNYEKKSNIHEIINDDGGRSVIGETVGQFTGILDINNKEVFEGDKTIEGIIEFNVETCCYIIRRVNGTFTRLDIKKDNLEIIGNIFEN